MLRVSCVFALTILALPVLAQDCSTYTFSIPNKYSSGVLGATDTQQHVPNPNVPSEHDLEMVMTANCTYSDQSNSNNCYVTCSTNLDPSVSTAGEMGTVTTGLQHKPGANQVTGQNNANGGSISCGAQVAGGVVSCLALNPNCSLSVQFSGSSGAGFGGSVSYSSTPLWNRTLNNNIQCAAETYNSSAPCPPSPPTPPTRPVGSSWAWDYSTCAWELVCNPDDPSCGSPIVIDTTGTGFDLTSAKGGVVFDFFGSGNPIQIAWTAAGSKNGWLALPENDGIVHSARDLFGNITPQYLTTNHPPNGFAALAIYDMPGFGGNRNGVIDPGDAVWSRLRIWIDTNHDGVSQPEELHTLDEFGIAKIDLGYRPDAYTDPNGNAFRYVGKLAPLAHDDVDRKIYDVFLATTAVTVAVATK